MGYRLDDSTLLLADGDLSDVSKVRKIHTFLEDANSPINSKYKERLFQSIIDKGHIDFGDIEKSAGDIKAYTGYACMTETLNTIKDLATEQKCAEAIRLADIVLTAIRNIEGLRLQYQRGFSTSSQYVMLEYNVYVYTCIEATTTLVYEFADYIKVPSQPFMEIKLKNTKLRANEFYFEQLSKFNSVNDSMGINYRKMLENMCDNGKSNFIGMETIVGLSAISAVAILIVPVTRSLIYRFYHLRNSISDSLDLQVKFLEMNKLSVESNESFTVEKRKEIVRKQEKLAQFLKTSANKIRVKSVQAQRSADAEMKKDDKLFTLDNLQGAADSDPLVLV